MMKQVLFLFMFVLLYTPAHATLVKTCICDAVRPDGGVLYNYANFSASGTGTKSEVCRDDA